MGPTACLNGFGKFLSPPGFDLRTVQPVESLYTGYTVRANLPEYKRRLSNLSCTEWLKAERERESERGAGFYLTTMSIAKLYGVDKIIRNFLRVPYKSL